MEFINTYRGTVMQWHCDQMGHMNVMWYAGKFDEAAWNLFAMMGASADYLRREDKAMTAVDQRIQYRRELLSGDTVVIGSGVLEIKSKAIIFVNEMRHAITGEIAATGRLTGCAYRKHHTQVRAVPGADSRSQANLAAQLRFR